MHNTCIYILSISSLDRLIRTKINYDIEKWLTNKVIGFKLKLILPTGGGKNGEWLGSDLPPPTGLDFAISDGNTPKPILTKPADLPSLSNVSRKKVSSS